MIRTLTATDIDRVAEIWLDTNIRAHHFISDRYWKEHFPSVKSMFAQAELYVYEDQDGIEGFIGLDGDYIAGLFIWSTSQSRGIGRQLLSFVKCLHPRLRLHVYVQNQRAIRFYQREGFSIETESLDTTTGEKEYAMLWTKEQP